MGEQLFPERNAEIIRRRTAGEAPGEIAAALGLTKSAVLGACNRAGLCVRGANIEAVRVVSDDQIRRIRALYVYGSRTHGLSSLAKRFGVSLFTVWGIVNRKTWKRVSDPSGRAPLRASPAERSPREPLRAKG